MTMQFLFPLLLAQKSKERIKCDSRKCRIPSPRSLVFVKANRSVRNPYGEVYTLASSFIAFLSRMAIQTIYCQVDYLSVNCCDNVRSLQGLGTTGLRVRSPSRIHKCHAKLLYKQLMDMTLEEH